MSKPIGIWVTGKNGALGWLEESAGEPALFKTLVDAKAWIKENTVHKELYEVKPFLLPPKKRRKPKIEEDKDEADANNRDFNEGNMK